MNEDESPRPPYSADLLADLHAGALDDDVAARLWPAVRRDADAMAVIAALDEVQSRLRSLGEAAPTASIPPEVAARIDTALAERSARPGRSRRLLTVAGIGAAAVLAVVFALVLRGVAQGDDGPGTVPLAAPPGEPAADAPLEPAVLRGLVGSTDPGPLAESARLAECLAANGFDPADTVLGSRSLRFADRDAVILLLAGPRPPQLTALVVGNSCAADDPATLHLETIG